MNNKPWKTVSELLGARRGTVFSVAPDSTVLAALESLAEHDIGALAVIEHGRMIGILSERDCVRKVELRGQAAKDTAVRHVMTRNVLYVMPSLTLDRCMALMKLERVRHLPVVQDSEVVGVVSARDILEDVAAEQAHSIQGLERDRLVMTVNTGSY